MLCSCQYPTCTNEMPSAKCKQWLNDVGYYKWTKERKMTREEAIKKCLNGLAMNPIELGDIKASQLVDMLEKLGLLKFDEEEKKEPVSLFEFKSNNVTWAKDYNKIDTKYGVIRLEEWPEGLVLWVGDEIKWKSWEKYYSKGDRVPLLNNLGGIKYGTVE